MSKWKDLAWLFDERSLFIAILAPPPERLSINLGSSDRNTLALACRVIVTPATSQVGPITREIRDHYGCHLVGSSLLFYKYTILFQIEYGILQYGMCGLMRILNYGRRVVGPSHDRICTNRNNVEGKKI
jgi:hypothetical protein